MTPETYNTLRSMQGTQTPDQIERDMPEADEDWEEFEKEFEKQEEMYNPK